MTPTLVRVTAGGEALAGFHLPGPASHFKLLLPAPGERDIELPEPGPDGLITFDDWATSPPIMRTYTARRFDSRTCELDIELVLHGDGPAARWAATVTPGARIAVSSPRKSGFALPSDAQWLLLCGDTSALPAMATILESDCGVPTTCFVEINDPAEMIDLPVSGQCRLEWILRDPSGVPGAALLDGLRSCQLPSTPGLVWMAAEATCIRQARQHLLTERGFARDKAITRGYWRVGAANHPDHDYGDDQLT